MTRTSATKGTQGFTLVELLAVLLVLALTTGILGLSLSGRQARENVVEFSHHMAQLLSLAQQDSQLTGTIRRVVIDLDKSTIAYDERNENRSIPPEFELTILVGQELIQSDGRIPVIFFSEGGSTGIVIKILNDQGTMIKVQTSWLTGLTRVVRNDSD